MSEIHSNKKWNYSTSKKQKCIRCNICKLEIKYPLEEPYGILDQCIDVFHYSCIYRARHIREFLNHIEIKCPVCGAVSTKCGSSFVIPTDKDKFFNLYSTASCNNLVKYKNIDEESISILNIYLVKFLEEKMKNSVPVYDNLL